MDNTMDNTIDNTIDNTKSKYYVVGKNKKTGLKHTWISFKSDINKIYPLLEIKICNCKCIGNYIKCTFENKTKFTITLNKCNNYFDKNIFNVTIPKNSFVFEFCDNDYSKLIDKFKLVKLD